ncbi:MAG: glycosyl hydrolase family 18 protein [Lachnospiraceae bacterium]
MKKKAVPVLAVAALILILITVMFCSKIIQKYTPTNEMADKKSYYGLTKEDEVAIVLNHTLAEVKGRVIDNRIYIDYQTLHDRINSRFYWDQKENKLLYTTADAVILVEAGSSEYYESSKKKSGDMGEIVKVDEKTAYVNLSFIANYTNMNFKVLKNPNRVLIQTEFSEQKQAQVHKDTEVRYRGGIKSEILTRVKKGSQLLLLREGKDWNQVMTKNGYIGYAKANVMEDSKKVKPEYKEKKEEFVHVFKEGKINMAWHQVTSTAANSGITGVLSSTKGINVISPTWFYLNDNKGDIVSLASSDYVNYCHANGVEVWGLVSNLEKKGVNSTKVLTHTSIRERLINKIVAAAIEYNLDGVNVDFEALSGDVGDAYIQFIRELSIKCHKNDLVVSVDNYVPSNYTAFYNRREQAVFADYVIVMAYDEHYAGSEPGSVSSIGFVTDGVTNTMKEVPKEQIILGLPFYTRVWEETPVITDEGEQTSVDVSSQAVGMSTAATMASVNGVEPTWDEETGQFYAEYQNGGKTYKIWMEEEASLEEKLKVMKENSLAGVSFWKLGFERSSAWDTIIKYLN